LFPNEEEGFNSPVANVSIFALLGSGIASILLASNRKVFALCLIIEIIKCFTVKLTRYYRKGKK
jgi:hypothetical protein